MIRKWRYAGIVLLTLLLIGSAAFVIWASSPASAETQALTSLDSNENVNFTRINNWLVFSPTSQQPEIGLILYPGGRVDYRAYAPHASSIASSGFSVVIVPMPLNLAFFGLNQADDVMQAFPDITNWIIGGHSLGGAMAAEFVSANPDSVDGLVLWASYPASSNDLSSSDLPIISIFASNDGLATLDDIKSSIKNLPGDTQFIEIKGGNHAGFGWYGDQRGDGKAAISQEDQQKQIVIATIAFLEMIGK